MRLVVTEFMTLDGVMEAPGLEEHRSGRNGWAMRISDDMLQAFNLGQVTGADALLFGRTTYHIWAAFWPTAPDVAAWLGKRINALPKYVVSKTLRDPAWENTIVLRGNLNHSPGFDCVLATARASGGKDQVRLALRAIGILLLIHYVQVARAGGFDAHANTVAF